MSDFALFGRDLFGDAIQPALAPLADRFVVPPFSVLDARQGEWQERKRAWLSIGLKSEIGRNSDPQNKGNELRGTSNHITDGTSEDIKKKFEQAGNTTSIFDPVVCELAYRWFCPDGGQIIDPFAGGSVRGIVASLLGYRYWGCDLRQEQIDANEQQADDILGATVPVNVSAAMMRQEFHACTADFIKNTCHGRCCSASDGGIKVTVHPSEVGRFRRKGAEIEDGFLRATNGRCPFQTKEGFCSTHDNKPFGCTASPFTINTNDTVIVRNRYRLLKCYRTEGAQPVYKAHAQSLAGLFGADEAARITTHLDQGGGDLAAHMPARHYAMLRDNDAAKGTRTEKSSRPVWIADDAMNALADAPPADLIFTCPPYGDLERYSDNPRDLSTMEYHTFLAAYKRVLLRACQKLRRGGMACIVVGDFRDRRTGNYRGFVADTINAFREIGLNLYNDAVLVTAVGSLPVRVGRQFESRRKLGKAHQNVLVFRK